MFFGRIYAADTAKKIITAAVLLLLTAAGILIYFFWGKPVIAFVTDAEKLHTYIKLHPLLSRLFFIFAVFMQVSVAIIPGESFELAAGYAFGAVEGCIICLIGIFAASALIFVTVKRFGQPAVELFFQKRKLHRLRFFKMKKTEIDSFYRIFYSGDSERYFNVYGSFNTDKTKRLAFNFYLCENPLDYNVHDCRKCFRSIPPFSCLHLFCSRRSNSFNRNVYF